MTSTGSAIVMNEFEVDAIIAAAGMMVHHFDYCSDSDASSDAGSDWLVPEEFSDDDDVDLQKELLHDQPTSMAALVAEGLAGSDGSSVVGDSTRVMHDDVFRGFIGMDTLRISLPPIQQEVMPELEADIIEEAIMIDEALKLRTAKALMRTYQHNPYHHPAVTCRTTSRVPDGTLSDDAYNHLPMCPCAVIALTSAHPKDISLLHKFLNDQKGIDTQQVAPIYPPLPPFSVSSVAYSPPPLPKSVPASPQRPMCCYFKQKGFCKMGATCWHAHEGDLYTPCHYGASCKAGHATLLQMQGPSHFPVAPWFAPAADALVAKSGITIRVGGSLFIPPHQTLHHHGSHRY
jgi:hypothetical protein